MKIRISLVRVGFVNNNFILFFKTLLSSIIIKISGIIITWLFQYFSFFFKSLVFIRYLNN